MSIITLTTDFGGTDAYVAAMKAVMLCINPQLQIVDICHSVEPHNVRQGAFIFSTVYGLFPPGTVHVLVVDPGVGASRKAIIVRTSQACFVAPDNGVLSHVLEQLGTPAEGDSVRPGAGIKVFGISNPRFWRSPVSHTFHGRDIFAPVAAHIATGVPLEEFGEPRDKVTVIKLFHPEPAADGSLVGHVQHIDNFGNIITDIKKADLTTRKLIVQAGTEKIDGLAQTYADSAGMLALIGSSGYLEIAQNQGSAADRLQVGIGDEVKVKYQRGG